MATEFNPTAYSNLQKRATSIEGALDSSPTAYSPTEMSTRSDLSKDVQLQSLNKQIDDMRSAKLREQWYGKDQIANEDVPKEEPGVFMRGLTALQAPLKAIVGTEKWALGKSNKGWTDTVVENAGMEGETHGGLLRELGAPRWVSMPLGFMLDVALDPVTWITAGGSSLVGGAWKGLYQGTKKKGLEAGLSAAKESAISNIGQTVNTLGRFAGNMPVVRPLQRLGGWGEKLIAKAAEKGGEEATSGLGNLLVGGAKKYKGLIEGIGDRATLAAENVDKLTSTTIYDKLGKGFFTNVNEGKTISGGAEDLIKKYIPKGEEIVDFFKYSPEQSINVIKARDLAVQAGIKNNILLTSKKGEAILKTIDEATSAMNKVVEGADAVKDIVAVEDTLENARKLLEMSQTDYVLKDLVKAYKVTPVGQTGVKWYDDFISGMKNTTVGDMFGKIGAKKWAEDLTTFKDVKDWKPAETFFNAYDNFISTFKWAKVAVNPSYYINSMMGNTVMAMMKGLPVEDPEFLKALWNNSKFLRGKKGATYVMDTFFSDANSWLEMMSKDEGLFVHTFGFHPSEISGHHTLEKMLIKSGSSEKEVIQTASSILSELEKTIDSESILGGLERGGHDLSGKIVKRAIAEKTPSFQTGAERVMKMMESDKKIIEAMKGSSWESLEAEASTNDFKKLKNYFAENKDNNPANSIINTLLNKMPVEHMDQTFKLTTADYLSRVGVPRSNLLTMSKQGLITKADILPPIKPGGRILYRLTPQKATAIALDTFMDYASMPDAVKVLKALPIVGSPFVSFSYAMLAKTGKTLTSNPAVINKIAFLMKDISDTRSPSEKEALQKKYNQYLNTPTMMKLGGMWNLDPKNWLPYLTLNMFNPSDRKYDDTYCHAYFFFITCLY